MAGTMAKAAADGHRVVLVVATRGELGEPVEGVLQEGQALWERRVQETHLAAGIVGVQRVEFLGYCDSGMMGESTNEAGECFWQADVDEAAKKLAAILQEEEADVLTVYDDNGGYGHPDHIQVHRVGVRAAEMVGTPRVYEATLNRDFIRDLLAAAPPEMRPPDFDPDDMGDFGSPDSAITTAVDVAAHVGVKREAMRAHASQISEEHFLLSMPDEVFAISFGIEWFIRRGQAPAERETSLFDGLRA
jgi:LmbE family N-acetylglucosaminyl deacetylase